MQTEVVRLLGPRFGGSELLAANFRVACQVTAQRVGSRLMLMLAK